MDDDWRARSSFDAFMEMGGTACWALTAGQVAVTLSNAGLSLAIGQQVQSCLPVPSWTSVDLNCGGLLHSADGTQNLVIRSEDGFKFFNARFDRAPPVPPARKGQRRLGHHCVREPARLPVWKDAGSAVWQAWLYQT